MIKANLNVKLVSCQLHAKQLFDVRYILLLFFRLKQKFSDFVAALRIEKGLKDIDTVEEEDITFEVVLSKPDARGKWMKDGKVLYPDQR